MEAASTTEFFVPGSVGQERDRVQPILYAIMAKMAQLLGLVPHITREQGIPIVENRPRDFADFVGTPSAEEYLLAIVPAMLCVPIEVCPIARKGTTIRRILWRAQSQVVGQLAMRALFHLEFGGMGEDCTVLGLVLTMASVSVVVLELSDVGTAGVDVTARQTKRAPLFDKETRMKLFGEKLFGAKKAKAVEASFEIEELPQGMPQGFRFLAETLMSVHHGSGTSRMRNSKGCRRSFSMQSHTAESIELGNYLGSGSFSHVLQLVEKCSDDVFIKIPKHDQVEDCLECEAEVLKDLCDNKCIPKLYDTDHPMKTLHIKIRCESSALPYLPMRGIIGPPANYQHRRWESDRLEFIAMEIYAALEYANSKGWAHLDVQPANIITRADPHGGRFEVMLIDWGCAHRTSEKLEKFVGCRPYAHDDLFDRTEAWYPCLDHDLASLAYTVACLVHGHIPWLGFEYRLPVGDDVKEERLKMASDILKPLLEKWGDESQKVKQALLNAIDRQVPAKRQKSG
jgi:Protein kinase domain